MASNTVVADLHFPEAPRWREGRLWFSDFFSGQVASVLPSGSDLRVEALVPEQPSGLGWLPDGRLLIVSMRDRRILRRETDGVLVVHADLSEHVTGHLNDMVVDSLGRAYVGNFGFDMAVDADFAPASLHRVDPDGTIVEVASDLWFPNGSVITEAGTLLVNETFGNRITAFDLTSSGDLVNRRTWASFGPVPAGQDFSRILDQVVVAPDGSCLGDDGDLWIADAGGGRLLRLTGTGEVGDEISPSAPVFACAIGEGTLFACTAPDFHEQPRKAARDGRIISLTIS